MSLTLKAAISQINVENKSFLHEKDRTYAEDLYRRHNLQTILETCSEFMKDQKLGPGYDKYIAVTRILVINAPEIWIRNFVIGFNDQSTAAICVTCLKSLSKIAEVPPFPGEIGDYTPDDFKGVFYRGYLVMSCLQSLFERFTEYSDRKELHKCAANVSYWCVTFVAMHHDDCMWTSDHSNTLAHSLLASLMAHWDVRTVSELLVLDLERYDLHCEISKRTSLLGKILQYWNPHLLRQTWKKNPTVAASFTWCMKQLKFPHTSDFLELILPPSLLFVDDFMGSNKEMGILCLISIMETAGAEELRWYGRADVIYVALKSQMYRTEESLLLLNLRAMMLILSILEKQPDDLSVQTRYDEIFLLLLQNASHENKLTLRRVHTKHLPQFIESLGINAVKYWKNVVDLAEEYLEISDAPEELARINILNTLISLIQVAWPRVQPHMTKIVKITIKLLHQINSNNISLTPGVRENLVSLSVRCISLLKAVDKEMIVQSLSALKQLPFSADCLMSINKMLEC